MYLLCHVQAKPSVVAKMQLFSFIHTKVSLFCHCRTSDKKEQTPAAKKDGTSSTIWLLQSRHAAFDRCSRIALQQPIMWWQRLPAFKKKTRKKLFTRETQHLSSAEKQLITAKVDFEVLQSHVDALQGHSSDWHCEGIPVSFLGREIFQLVLLILGLKKKKIEATKWMS